MPSDEVEKADAWMWLDVHAEIQRQDREGWSVLPPERPRTNTVTDIANELRTLRAMYRPS